MPEWLVGGFDSLLNLFGVGYNLHTNQRDYEYQLNLQKHLEEREDNAVQRRMADLQAAGLNPNLAAGSAAQAGPVVNRSSTNDLNIGSIIDTINAVKTSKLLDYQKAQSKVNLENTLLDQDKKAIDVVMKRRESALREAQVYTDLGIPHMSMMVSDDDGNYWPVIFPNTEFDLYNTKIEQGKQYELEAQIKQLEQLGLDIDYSTLQNELSQIDVDFASANYVSKFLSILIKAIK